MSLANGLSYLAIPGPSVMPERVLRAMHRSAPNIYHGELPELVPGIVERLKTVARTSAHVAMYITNGHGAWEAAAANVFSPGDLVLVLATGRFAEGWADIARAMGVETEILDYGKCDTIDLDQVRDRLRADDGRIKAIMVVQTDTSTGIRNDIAALRAVIDETGHDALFMVDCMASLGCDRFEMDAWGVDVMIAGSQKGLMTPPGLGFVYFSDKADRARETARCVTHYWDWRPRVDPDYFYRYFDGTAPTHHLYGLDEAIRMIEEEGLENVWTRHAALAQAIWAAFDHWGSGGPLEINITDPALRSHSVTALRVGSDKATALRQWCETKAGLTLGIGLGMAEPGAPEWHNFFRIGHMGHVNAQMILGALATIEAGLKAVELPHTSGGIERAAAVIADLA
ncbi:MAG: aminotransferase class V-fold PLP-dependent enzyme [Silicimonas sp.]|jgi:alanine-glyoxylate transaminase/serine-glyoxylate transaminase/serine-pyruvate transaminase|nr:aminotransferase class V-fold PLP-dependent enzyme [Silicimonas sp.]